MTTDSANATPANQDEQHSAAYAELVQRVRDVHTLQSTASLLEWDQETHMPNGGIEHRSKQLEQLAGMSHDLFVSDRLGELLATCESDADLTADALSPAAVNVREIRRDYDRARRLPADLVRELARVTSLSQHAWMDARKADDFNAFRPWLEQVVTLKRREAECHGWAPDGEPWDALADAYEPGCTARDVANVFEPLRPRLVALVEELTTQRKPAPNVLADLRVPVDKQQTFVRWVVEQLGFDFNAGRLDVSTHPFCIGISGRDVRMTTRYAEDLVADALGSAIHETGHGLYDQGLPLEYAGLPMGEPVGLSVHESQSRLWENLVARSRPFWQWCQPHWAKAFGGDAGKLTADELYAAFNHIEAGFIRVDADEATYNLHIMIRFELERALLKGDLTAADLPSEWNARYKAYLGLDVPSDRLGCLQDIHWSMGALGYFPTYTMGNLLAAQFYEQARSDMPDLDDQIARGSFVGLKTWLNENIHSHGRRYTSASLCQHVTGSPPTAEPLLNYLAQKLRPMYGI